MSLDQLTRVAARHGMEVNADPARPEMAAVFCRTCGWPGARFMDLPVAAYLEAPSGCAACATRARQAPGDTHDFWPQFKAGGSR